VAAPVQPRCARFTEAHRLGEPSVVEVVGEPHPGIGLLEPRLVLAGEEQGVGVGRGKEEVAAVPGPLRVVEGELREGREPALVALGSEAFVEHGEGPGRVLAEALAQREALEDLNGTVRGTVAREDVRRELAVDPERVGAFDLDCPRCAPRGESEAQ